MADVQYGKGHNRPGTAAGVNAGTMDKAEGRAAYWQISRQPPQGGAACYRSASTGQMWQKVPVGWTMPCDSLRGRLSPAARLCVSHRGSPLSLPTLSS